jgi:hypothetical protein
MICLRAIAQPYRGEPSAPAKTPHPLLGLLKMKALSAVAKPMASMA